MKWSMGQRTNERKGEKSFYPDKHTSNILRNYAHIDEQVTTMKTFSFCFFLQNLLEREQTLRIRQVKIDSSQKYFRIFKRRCMYTHTRKEKEKLKIKSKKYFWMKTSFFLFWKGFNMMFFGSFSWQLLLIEDYSCFFPWNLSMMHSTKECWSKFNNYQ
jgi:hypothetical protein